MSGPDRIWAKTYYGDTQSGYWQDGPILPNMPKNIGTEYARADLPPPLSAALALPEVKALVEALIVAEDALSRQSWQWTGAGPHPQEVIEAVRAALAAVREAGG